MLTETLVPWGGNTTTAESYHNACVQGAKLELQGKFEVRSPTMFTLSFQI